MCMYVLWRENSFCVTYDMIKLVCPSYAVVEPGQMFRLIQNGYICLRVT